MLLDKLVEFAQQFPQYKSDPDWIKEQIIRGLMNGTVDWWQVNGEIKAFVRFNIINESRVADILDLIISKGERGIELMRLFTRRAKQRFPSLQYIRFERDIKYPQRPHRMIEIEKLL